MCGRIGCVIRLILGGSTSVGGAEEIETLGGSAGAALPSEGEVRLHDLSMPCSNLMLLGGLLEGAEPGE